MTDFLVVLFRDLWPARRRKSSLERYLGQAVDFADLEHRMRTAQESERRPMW
jgi:hypothetical protein